MCTCVQVLAPERWKCCERELTVTLGVLHSDDVFWLTVCMSGCTVSLATGALLQTQHVDVFSLVT